MKTFCIRLCLIAALVLLCPAPSRGLTPADRNGAGGIQPEGGVTALEQSLWRAMCPAHTGLGTVKNGTITMVNDYVARLLGYSRQELLGQGERMLYPDEDEYALVHEEMRTLDSRPKPLSVETCWKAKDGSLRDVHLYCTPLDPGDPSAGIVFTVQDITERKQAELVSMRRAGRIHAVAVAVVGALVVLFFLLARKQKRLRQSEQELTTFKEAFENLTDAVGMATPQGRHYYQNRAFDNLFGTIGEDPIDRFVDPAVGKELFAAIMSGRQWTGEAQMYGRGQKVIDVFLRAYPNRNKSGTIISLVGILSDITAGKQAAAALRESEKNVSNILNTIDDVVMSYSFRDDRLIYVSPSLKKIFGMTMNDHEQEWHRWVDFVHPDDLHVIDDNVARLSEHGSSDEEFRVIRPDGSIAWVRSRSKLIYTATGEAERLDRVITDITDRKQAEIALRESEAKLAALFSSMTELVVINELVFDEQGQPVNYRISDCNRAFTEVTGIAREAAVGRLATEVYGTAEPPYLEEFSRVALTGESCRFETFFSPMQKHFSISVVCPGRNRFATISTDITTRRQSEEAHERLQAQLGQAQKIESIGRLAGGVAHDFNNILSVILGYTDMALQHVEEGQPLRTDLLEIRQAIERSSKLTRQLLAFARKQAIAPRVLDLNATVEEMLKMLRRLIGEDIDLAWLPGKNLQPVRVDPSQLDQVLANLCVNARDAIADVGRITIETANVTLDETLCERHPDCVPGDYVMLAVSDDGCGMDEETLANIFDPFFTTKDVGTGTGLGLSTVYGIVKQNNGCIDVRSEPARGSRFSIYLPQHREEAGQAAGGARPGRPVARGAETIVLVEDEPANLEMCRRMLAELGYTVLPAATPEECFRLVREHEGRIDLLMTDVVMPGMNGPDLANSLCAAIPGLKCLFMSGYTDKALNYQEILATGIDLIQKPFSFEELADRIRRVLKNAPGA